MLFQQLQGPLEIAFEARRVADVAIQLLTLWEGKLARLVRMDVVDQRGRTVNLPLRVGQSLDQALLGRAERFPFFEVLLTEGLVSGHLFDGGDVHLAGEAMLKAVAA